ncbi:flagellar motor stator protein MotA [Bacillus salitolerans]|uniref:Flagellar motor stator protein MotA n=1 Tax=Bacillus salitolerans TaxID=1437434 RepID=A0ABW4LK11_9BACI
MDKATIIGLILALLALLLGMFFKHVPFGVLLNPAAFFIIIVGTAAAVTIGFPGHELKRIPKLFGVLFKTKTSQTVSDLIPMFTDWANIARKEGLLALEAKITEIDDHFLKNGLSLAIDGQSPEFIRDVMNEEIDAMEERHLAGAGIFTQAGTYAPTLGVLGAVVGLIAALGNMADIDALGAAIAAAFVATLLGIFTGYVLWHPFANKLKRKSKEEIHVKRVMIEGVLSVLDGQSPTMLEQKLASYLPHFEREKYYASQGGKSDE